jgi:hypothetical protein
MSTVLPDELLDEPPLALVLPLLLQPAAAMATAARAAIAGVPLNIFMIFLSLIGLPGDQGAH